MKKKTWQQRELGKFCSYYGHNTIIAPLKRKNKQNNIKGKKSSTESKFQKKFVKNTNKSKSSNKTTLKKEDTNMLLMWKNRSLFKRLSTRKEK